MRCLAALGFSAALMVAAAGCGAEDPPSAPPAGATTTTGTAPTARRSVLCSPLRVRITGRIGTPAVTELSGLVLSRSQPGVLWTHNDSGDRARLFAVARDGRLLAEVAVAGAESFDWEDIAATRGTLLIGDIGDNIGQRASVTVYRVTEPRVGRAVTRAAPATRYDLRYPDRPRDAETLLHDPSNGRLVIVEKNFGGRAGVYVADRLTAGATTTLRRSGRLELRPGEAVTAGDVSADGRTIALRTYDRVLVWLRRPNETVARALRRRPCVAREGLLAEGQGEALALRGDGRAFYTVTEGARPPIRSYAPR